MQTATRQVPNSAMRNGPRPDSADVKIQQHGRQTKPEKPTGEITPERLNQFSDAFGDKAMDYLQAGLSFEDANLQFKEHCAAVAEAEVKQLKAKVAQRDAELQTAKQRLRQLGDSGDIPRGLFADGVAVRN